MKQFKPGDKVKRIRGPNASDDNMYINTIYTVKSQIGIDTTLEECIFKYITDYFELVESYETLELQELVKKANEGERACKIIVEKYGEEVEFKKINGDNWDICKQNVIYEYRLKPKKQFESFTTTNGFLVSLNNDILTIGCKQIDVKEVKKVLTLFCENNNIQSNNIFYFSKRSGIGVIGNEKNVLPWVDADKILEKLKELE